MIFSSAFVPETGYFAPKFQVMQTIKFRVNNRDDAFFQALQKEVSTWLDKQKNGRYANTLMLVKGVLFLSLFWGAYALILFGGFSSIATILLYASMGVSGLLIAFNISHDACHDALTSSKLFNKVVYYLTFNPLGTDAYLWKLRHVHSHHPFPNVDHCDIDIDNNFLIRLSPNRPLLRHHRWQHVYGPFLYALYTLHWVFIKDWAYLFRKDLANLRDIKHPPGEVFGMIAAKAFYFFYLIVLPVGMGLHWATVLIGFLALHVVMSYFFLLTNIMNHHAQEADFPIRDEKGYLPGSWAQHQIATCVDFHPKSRVWNFFFGGFNSHAAHHLFPTVCHVHYVKLSEFIIDKAAAYGVAHKQMSWWAALVSHFRHLYDLGHMPPRTQADQQSQEQYENHQVSGEQP